MPRLSIWNSGKKGNTYNYLDKIISSYFGAGGTAAYLHAFLGAHDQVVTSTPAQPSLTGIEDVLFLENRDRKYASDVIEMRTIYNVTDSDFDMSQFGLFLQGDTIFLEFHMNDMIALLGRKIIPGDVIELPHQRDDLQIDLSLRATNKFYVVEDASKASGGFSATWFPHIWRVKIVPMTGSQEFSDILNGQALDPLGLPMINDNGTPSLIGDLMTTMAVNLGINESVVASAQANVKKRYFETQQFYVVPAEAGVDGRYNPWIFSGDGIPPNGAALVGSGNSFPSTPSEGDYYLRTDYDPPTLFMRVGSVWKMQEVDYRGTEWNVMHRFMKEFVFNNNITTNNDGTTMPERVNLSKAVRPKADF